MRVKLSVKLILLVVFAVMISAISSMTVSYFSVREGFNRLFSEFLSTNMLVVQGKIDQYVDSYKSLAVAQSSRSNVINGIGNLDHELLNHLSKDLVKSGQTDFIYFVDINGVVLGNSGSSMPRDGRVDSSCITKALSGNVCTDFVAESGNMIVLQAASPVFKDSKIIGATLVGMDISNGNALVDSIKKMLNTEVTIFLGNQRISSTIMENGHRVVGTKLDNELVLETVLKKKMPYEAVVTLFSKPHMSIYWPISDSTGKSIGMMFLGKDMSTIKESEDKVFNRILYVCLAAMVVLTIIGFFVSKLFTTPILKLAAFAQRVEQGDYSSVSNVKTNDEIGDLAASVDRMVVALNDKICEADSALRKADQEASNARLAMEEANAAKAQAERKAEGMLQAALQLEGVVQVVSSASEELSAQIEQSSRGADEQSGRVRETATAMEEMNATVLEVAKNAQQAADISNQARQHAQEGAQIVNNAGKSIEAVHTQSIAIKEDMDALGKQAEGIGQIMGVIADIADQTNLLALNAAIEAARAGDAGRGFAVVADEVRKLAEKTMTATQEVGQAITGIQEGTRKNIHNVEQAGVSIEEAAKLSAQSGESLKQILEFVHMVNDQVQSIATASEQQSAASEEINHSVEQVATISVETAQAMEQASSAVAELAQQSQALQRLIVEMKNG